MKHHFHLKYQENSLKKQSEIDLTNLPVSEFKKGVNEYIEGLRRAIDRNAYYCKKEVEPIKRSQLELENSFAGQNLS